MNVHKAMMMAASLAAWTAFGAPARKAPPPVVPCEPPPLADRGFVADGPVAARLVPLDGWGFDTNGVDAVQWNRLGLQAVATNAVIKGRTVDALQVIATFAPTNRDRWTRPAAAYTAFEFDPREWSVVSFKAKVEIPAAAPQAYFEVNPGSGKIRVIDGAPGADKDGWQDVILDLQNDESVGRSAADDEPVRFLSVAYPREQLPTGCVAKVTIADMKLVKGAHIKFEEPERWKKWVGFVSDYEPDLSDSSRYLEPPPEGRLPAGSSVRLAAGGQARAEIVVDLSDAIRIDNFFPTNVWNLELRAARGHEVPVARLAAYELAHWLKEVTGGDFPVLTAPSKDRNTKILLGATYAKDLFPGDLKKLASGGSTDGFAVRMKGGNVYIFGARPAGTLYGVYRFIENNTDLIWAYPREAAGAAVYTKNPDLKAVWGDACVKPVFIQRGWSGGHDDEWMRHNGANFGPRKPDEGFFCPSGGHWLSPQYYDCCVGLRRFNAVIKPGGPRRRRWSEWQGLCCLANPEFLPHAVEVVPNIKNLDYTSPFDAVMGIDDNPFPCRCPLCSAPIRADDGRLLTPRLNYGEYYSAWFYRYLNKVDDLIQKEHPGYVTSTYAYYYTRMPPPIKVNKTIVPWLCYYIRGAAYEPVYSPRNLSWYKMTKGWAAHSTECMLYDYYGFENFAPLSEMLQENMRFQRDIGFPRTSTEGFMGLNHAGIADDRWCITRLAWDPDADIEQLHRYFNRRTYREAAPWMDKYRGTIRRAYLRARRGNALSAIKQAKLEPVLRGYLAEAKKAVRHPMAKILVDQAAADFELALKNAWPAAKKAAARPAPAPTEAETTFAAKGKEILGLAKKGDVAAATNLLAAACADRLVPEETCNLFLARQALPAFVAGNPGLTGVGAVEILRRHFRDDVGRANGHSRRMEGRGAQYDIEATTAAFFRRGSFDDAAAVYDAWADWDGDRLPAGLRAHRLDVKMENLRSQVRDLREQADWCRNECLKHPGSGYHATRAGVALARLGGAMAAEEACRAGWRQALQRCARDGANAQERGDASMRLLKEDWDRMNGRQRRAAVDRLVFDDFMKNGIRRDAAMLIPGAFADGGTTNWSAAADHVIKAISDGDWSNLHRDCYSRQFSDDFRLDVLCAAAEKMIAAGEKTVAKSMLERGAPILFYTATMIPGAPQDVAPDSPDMKKRLALLDAVMAKCGATRK